MYMYIDAKLEIKIHFIHFTSVGCPPVINFGNIGVVLDLVSLHFIQMIVLDVHQLLILVT